MFKNLFSFSAMALMIGAAALTTTSCSSDELVMDGNGDEVAVTFTAKLPAGLQSRAENPYGDGTTATKLTYVVYTTDGTQVEQGTATFNSLTATVNLRLVNGESYKVAFWAQNPDAPYAFDAETATVSANYDASVKANDEALDAFYAYVPLTVNGNMTPTVELYRPFAQINIMTGDKEEATASGLYPEQSKVTVDVPTTFNLATGEVGDSYSTVVFYEAALPQQTTTVTVAGGEYHMLAMNYVFAPAAKTVLSDVKMDIFKGTDHEKTYANIPVQRNYRTNIYGNLLTSSVSYEVEIKPGFTGFITDDIIVRPVDLPDGTKVNLAFVDVTLADGTELKSAAIVNTPEEFLAANVLSAETVYVPEEATVDLSQRPDPIEITGKTTIYINGTVNTSRAQILATGADADVTVIGNGIESSRSTGTGTLQSVGTPTSSRPINALNGAKLTVRNLNVVAQQNSGGSAIFSENADVTLERVNVTCHNFAVAANGGKLYAKDCIFNTDSNNKEGAFSYCVGINGGCQAVLENCHIIGIQGGLSVQNPGSKATVKGGRYETLAHPDYGDGITFYPVYTCWGSKVLIESGEFICGNPNRWSVYCGNNDVPPLDSYGAAELRGGKYNTPTWDEQVKSAIEMPEGYEWIKKEEGEFKYAVVEKK